MLYQVLTYNVTYKIYQKTLTEILEENSDSKINFQAIFENKVESGKEERKVINENKIKREIIIIY